MARNDPQMNLCVPMELKEKIEKAALNNGRTITSEAVYRLEESFKSEFSTDINQFSLEELLIHIAKKFNNSGLRLTLEEINKNKNRDI